MKSFSPGQLVRLRLYWDDIDDDIEIPESEVRAPSPAYYAQKEPCRAHFECDAIYPGQIGLFLTYEKIPGIQDPSTFWSIVLIGEQKYKFPPGALEVL